MKGDNRPSLKLAGLPALREIYRFSATLADEDLGLASRRYEQSLDRRDKLRERTRFGLLALNATSLIALLTSLGSQWVGKFQITEADLAQTVLSLLVGMMAGAISIWWSGITATNDAARDFEDLIEVRQRKAEYDKPATVEAENELVNRPLPQPKVPPDYRWSKIDNILTSLAGAAWLGAVGSIVWRVAHHVEWCRPWCD